MPAKPLLVLPAAGRDIDAATDWYLDQGGEMLAGRWVQAVETALRHVAARPGTGSSRHAAWVCIDALRAWPVRKFPYLVFYIEDASAVSVIRVLHGQRDLPQMLGGGDEVE